MKKIELSLGKYALVDDSDYDYLSKWKWYAHRKSESCTFYAIRTSYDNLSKITKYMHRVIADKYVTADYEELDHIDRDGLNNQKENLRTCTRGENNANRRNWGKYPKGVSRHVIKYEKKSGIVSEYVTYRSRINVKGKSISLGSFKELHEATESYEIALKKYYPGISYE